MIKTFNELQEQIKSNEKKTIAIVNGQDNHVLDTVKLLVERDLAKIILTGDKKEIIRLMEQRRIKVSPDIQVIECKDCLEAARKSVELIRLGEADILMKGLIGTADFLRAVLDKNIGLRLGKELTHVSVIESEKLNRLLVMSDCALHIAPSLEEKVEIIKMVGHVIRQLGIKNPKIAVLGAVEQVNPKMVATIDAAILTQMSKRGQLGDVIVDGPLAMDIAINEMAAEHKGVRNRVAGCADGIIMPNIEAGNILWKTLVYLSDAKIAGVVLGAKVPIVLTSRSDSEVTKFNSINLALLMARK